MAPILYGTEASPPVRAVLLTAEAIGLELKFKEVNFIKKDNLKPEYVKMNPQHTIPTLDDNGFIIWDSHAICAYLVGKYAKDDALYPKDLQKRAVVDQRLHFDSGVLFSRLRSIVLPILVFGRKDISSEDNEGVLQGYEFTNTFLEGNAYFAGQQLTIADFCALASLSSIIPVVPMEASRYPHLDRWIKKMKMLPYYQEKNGNGAEAISVQVNKLLGR